MNAREFTVYQCGECEAAYKTIESAENCCKPSLCACGATILKTQWRCDKCKDHADKLKWECAERKPCPKDGWLYSKVEDKYFQDHGEFLEEMQDIDSIKLDELMALPAAEFAREYQVYICKTYKPQPFDMSDHFQDFCFEDHELPGLWLHADQSVNDWIASVPDNDWPQVSSAIAWNGEYAK
jgi:hypothetical protein